MQRVTATIDRSAISHNCALLDGRTGMATRLCAVVKANGYGHGARISASAAIAGGAEWLAVAAAAEALELRSVGLREPILVMGSVDAGEIDALVEASCDLAVWSRDAAERAASAALERGRSAGLHVKLDTGMGRLGTRDSGEALSLVAGVEAADGSRCAGLMTHFATADESDDSFLREQLSRFSEFVTAARPLAPESIAHAANSAATLRLPEAHFDMVRCGIGIYGLDPFGADPEDHGLRPALAWTSWVGAVKHLEPGESVGYGRRFIADSPTLIGTVPVGYADGFSRLLGNRAEVIVGGSRVPVVGTVSMDNITVDLGPDSDVQVGEQVVLLGASGGERILAEELAVKAETINYEIATSIGGRTVRDEAG